MTTGLLDILIQDQQNALPRFKPGTYWEQKSWAALRSLRTYGIDDFRSSTGDNVAALSLGGVDLTDVRLTYGRSLASRVAIRTIQFSAFWKIFDSQVALTRSILKEKQKYERTLFKYICPERLEYLLDKYSVERSINFGCTAITEYSGIEYSTHYLSLADQLAHVDNVVNIQSSNKFLEIGAGFGANVHLIEQNIPSIRKYLIVDIVPTVYLASEYIRSLSGSSVTDYLDTRSLQSITFRDDNSLEIIVIPPWQLSLVQESIDIFWNANSFVEMSEEVINMYSTNIFRLSNPDTKYAFMSYDKYNPTSVLDPYLIPRWFSFAEYNVSRCMHLFDQERSNTFFLGGIGDSR